MADLTHYSVRDRVAQLKATGNPVEAIAFRLRVAHPPAWALWAFGVQNLHPHYCHTVLNREKGVAISDEELTQILAREGARPELGVAYAYGPGYPPQNTIAREEGKRRLTGEILAYRGWRILRRICERWVSRYILERPDAPFAARRLVRHFGLRADGLIALRMEKRRGMLDNLQQSMQHVAIEVGEGVPLAERNAYPDVPPSLRAYIPDMFLAGGSSIPLEIITHEVGSLAVHELGIGFPDTDLPEDFVDFLWEHRHSGHWSQLVSLHQMWADIPEDIRALTIREMLVKLHSIRGYDWFRRRIANNDGNMNRWLAARRRPRHMPVGDVCATRLAGTRMVGGFLGRDDYRGVVLGELTGCCQSVGGSALHPAWHGHEDPLGAFFVIEDTENEVYCQSWLWRDQTGRALGIDSIETLANHACKDKLVLAFTVLYLRMALWMLGRDFGYGQPVGEILLGPSDRLRSFQNLVALTPLSRLKEAVNPGMGALEFPPLLGREIGPNSNFLFPFRASWALAREAILEERDRLQEMADDRLLDEFMQGRAFRSAALRKLFHQARLQQAQVVAEAVPQKVRWTPPTREPLEGFVEGQLAGPPAQPSTRLPVAPAAHTAAALPAPAAPPEAAVQPESPALVELPGEARL